MNNRFMKKGIILGLIALIAVPVYPMSSASTLSSWTTWATSGLLNQAKEHPWIVATVGAASLALGAGAVYWYKQKYSTRQKIQCLRDSLNTIDNMQEFFSFEYNDNIVIKGCLKRLLQRKESTDPSEIDQLEKDQRQIDKIIQKYTPQLNQQREQEESQSKEWQVATIDAGYCYKKGSQTKQCNDCTATQKHAISNYYFFAVYDGKESNVVSEYAKQHLHDEIAKQLMETQNVSDALTKAFAALDEKIKQMHKGYESIRATNSIRSTAVVALINKKTNELYIASVGNSRALVINNSNIALKTKDHTTSDQKECDRIWKSGGFISNQLACGRRSITRALGDFTQGYPEKPDMPVVYQDKVISSTPSIYTCQLEKDDIVLLFSDGLLQLDEYRREGRDENTVIKDTVNALVEDKYTPQRIVHRLISHEMYRDDTSVIVIKVK